MTSSLTLIDAWASIAEISSEAEHPDHFAAALDQAAALTLAIFMNKSAPANVGVVHAQICVSTDAQIPALNTAVATLCEKRLPLISVEALLLCSRSITAVSEREGHYLFEFVMSEKMWQLRTRVMVDDINPGIRMRRLYLRGSFQRRAFEEAKRGLARNKPGTRHPNRKRRRRSSMRH